ncbi:MULTISPECIES: ATP-binding cassette domain-containing protein [Bosea]|uniref:ATP-binding cassette domain-containing protein n=1 Tax=Bosea TaxID=85413 RepID=UPI00214FDA05|nr:MULTISPECIES: ATP-binding cassette domain-containing protein [Bosea]MCR4522739.1 ATP-binding cassette domain-containing protein [Bosea sp. 47.2.35]MDR6826445.1 branched-chain amino acid transport system ATP-binding protein [Bosea robiniae]MDR6893155.1 branched-chain amino acid transport system ATP-binding protein [Bosea sp. BE109]MDR7137146.1 branched-chain amino acid transport system ATP-binding protein [Bosea sp. BE168]MDR7173846.1 branched-chain amino acid transport system ATP-binding pr
MLRIEGVSAAIAGVQVLRSVSLGLTSGRTTILIGRNGAGKTTTLRAIMGLLPVQGGSVRLGGEEIGATPAYRRAAQGIGYAPEDRRLVPEFTVEDNILLPALALSLPAAERARRLDEVYALLPQLKTMRKRPGGGVSGGQGKMVALGRALMVARTALLLDEPFQGLAPALALEYARTLGELRRNRPDLAILVTESTPALLDAIADETLQIERGEIN